MRLIESGIKNEVINLGNPIEISIKNIAILVMTQLGIIPRYNITTAREGDHMKRCPDISKITQYIGTYDFTSLESGVQEYIEYYKTSLPCKSL